MVQITITAKAITGINQGKDSGQRQARKIIPTAGISTNNNMFITFSNIFFSSPLLF